MEEETATEDRYSKNHLDSMADTEKTQEVQQERAATPTSQGPEIKKDLVVDTLHNDEAMKVLAAYEGDDTWTKEEEGTVRRKIDKKLLPILCLTYALQYYDKGELRRMILVSSAFCSCHSLVAQSAPPTDLS